MEPPHHSFIFAPASWVGEGKIQLNMVEEELLFCTKWTVVEKDSSGKIECLQEIQVKGLSEVMHNQFLFFDFTSRTFSLELDNHTLGKITGKGIISDKTIAWEFRSPKIGFEGFELYEWQADHTYLMHAEYASADQFRTVIRGRVWQELNSRK